MKTGSNVLKETVLDILVRDDVLKVINELGGCDATEEFDKGHDQAIGSAYYAVVSMKSKTATLVLEEIKEKMCDQYCKYPEQEKSAMRLRIICDECPLSRL